VPLLFLAFTLLPFAELFILIRMGRTVGAGSTLAFVIAMGLLGAALAKSQGRKVITEWQQALAAGRVPEEGVLGGVLVFVGGLLLITPGVLTDVAGFFCLLPVTRRAIARRLGHYLSQKVAQGQVRVHNVGFNWPQGPSSPSVDPRRPSPRKPLRREDVIDTEGEEV